MAILANVGNDGNILTDIGSPTLGGTDVINILKGSVNYSTNLGALSTAVAQFNSGPDFDGVFGNYPDGLLVQAGTIRLADSGRRHALKGDNSGTVDLFEFKCKSAPEVSLSLYATITLAVLAAPGFVSFLDSANPATVQVTAGACTAFLEAGGTAVTTLLVAPKSGTARGIAERDVGTVTIKHGGVAEVREDSSPTTVNNDGGTYVHASSGGIGTINAGSGAVFDFSGAGASIASITWALTGDIVIILPSGAISIDLPTSGEQGAHRIEYRDGV